MCHACRNDSSAQQLFSFASAPEAAIDRRNVVLKRMLELGMIPASEYEKARGEPRGSRSNQPAQRRCSLFCGLCQQQLHDLYDEKVLGSEGLNIYTDAPSGNGHGRGQRFEGRTALAGEGIIRSQWHVSCTRNASGRHHRRSAENRGRAGFGWRERLCVKQFQSGPHPLIGNRDLPSCHLFI